MIKPDLTRATWPRSGRRCRPPAVEQRVG